jgi:hypothetical protein
VIAFVIDRVAQEDTPGGTWGELMWRGDSRVRAALITKKSADAHRRARNQIGQGEDMRLESPSSEDGLTGT